MKIKVIFLHLAFFALFAILVLRAFYLQVLPQERLTQRIQNQFLSSVEIKSRRGDIFDKNGILLATSVLKKSAYVDPFFVKDSRALSRVLAKVLGMDFSRVVKKIKQSKKRFIWIKRKLKEEEYQRLISSKVDGLFFLDEFERVYFNQNVLSHIIGKVDIDGKALSGLELEYDKILKGKPVTIKTRRDGRGRLLVSGHYELYKDQKGKDLHLNLDIESQVYASKVLKKQLEQVGAKKAWALVMDVKTGAITTSAQVFKGAQEISRTTASKNIAVSNIYEPGSILKAFSFTKALSHLDIKPSDKFSCGNKGFKIKRRKIRNSHIEKECEDIEVYKAFSKSLNTVSADLALQLGEQKLLSFYKSLGLDKKTKVDFPGEASPIFHNQLTGPHHLASLSFGHGISLNSLQVLKAYSAVANKGYSVSPRYAFESVRKEKAMSSKESQMLKTLLSYVVSDEGTARQARVPRYFIGGKTGTAQKADLINGGYTKEVLSSFIGLFPLTRPRYIALVYFDEPQKLRSGGAVAAPVFSSVAEFILRKESIQPDALDADDLDYLLADEKTVKGNKINAREESSSLAVNGTLDKAVVGPAISFSFKSLKKVPSLKGMSLRELMKFAKNQNLSLQIKGHGRVKRTFPRAGQRLPENNFLKVDLESI